MPSMKHDPTNPTCPGWCVVPHLVDRSGADVEHLAAPVTFTVPDTDATATVRVRRYDEYDPAGVLVGKDSYIELALHDEENVFPDGSENRSWTRMTAGGALALIVALIPATRMAQGVQLGLDGLGVTL